MKIKNIKKTLFIFLVSSFLVLVIIPGTMAIFSEKESATINLNVEAPSFTVTFDANGGIASFASKDIAYGHEYGELPTAEKCGSTFLGWYTGLTDGIKIESTTTFNIMDEQTLYARYEDSKELYDVLKCEAERTDILNADKLAGKYSGNHQDSMDASLSTREIYHTYALSNAKANEALDANNVVFAEHCWQIIRTTDTGGVKLLYNGEPTITEQNGELQYYCGTNRPGHFGSIKSTRNLAGVYYYSSSYTTSVSGNSTIYTLESPIQVSIDNTNAFDGISNIVNDYPYTCGNTSTSCSTLYKVDSVSNGTEAYVYKSTFRDSIGESTYSSTSNSLSDLGYMNNLRYTFGRYEMSTTKRMLNLDSLLSSYENYYYSDEIEISGVAHRLINPTKGIELDNYPMSLVGKYTCKFNNLNDCRDLYYISAIDTSGSNTKLYAISLYLGSGSDPAQYKFLFSDGIENNSNGTFTMTGIIEEINQKDWGSEYSTKIGKYVCMPGYYTFDSVNNKYICSDNGRQNVGALRYVSNVTVENFTASSIYKFGNAFEIINGSYKIVGNSDKGTLQYIYNWTDASNENCFDDDENIVSNCGYNSITKSHYTCLNMTGVCTEYMFTYSSDKSYIAAISLIDGDKVSTNLTDTNNVLYKMLYQNDESGIVNTYDSEVKKVVDNWYYNTLYNEYDQYIEDTIYCNNRSIAQFGGWDPNGDTSVVLTFKDLNGTDGLSCENITDRFSVTNNKAKLNYKVGMINKSEMNLLNKQELRVTSSAYWTFSPNLFYSYYGAQGGLVSDSGTFGGFYLGNPYNVRPSISLIPGIKYTRGTGATDNPYVIDTSGN